MSENNKQSKAAQAGDPSISEDLVESTVYVAMKDVDTGLDFSLDVGFEQSEFYKWVSDNNPEYRADCVRRGWPTLYEQFTPWPAFDAKLSSGSVGDLKLVVKLRSKPSEAWRLKNKTSYEVHNGEGMPALSTPVHPGQVHRSFLVFRPKDGLDNILPDEGPRFQLGNYFQFQRVAGGDENDVIEDGEEVYLRMMTISEYDPDTGTPLAFDSRGFVGKQKDKTGRFEFKYLLGSEDYTNVHEIGALKFKVSLSWPPNRHGKDEADKGS